MNVQLRTVGQKDTDRAITAMRSYIADNFPERVKVEIAGNALVEISLNNLVVRSQLSSVAASLLMVFLILAFYYRSAIAGLIALAPLAISILINFGVMGYFGIKLNIGTAMVASIAVGVGIDYIIHYMAAYHHEYLRRQDDTDFLLRTFQTSGKAIIFNAASVGAGFAVLAFSRFNMLAYFGGLVTLTMATSSLVSLTVLPVLLDVLKPAFIRKPQPFDKSEALTEEST
jgi:predicted RND superfamily exporter protein